VARDANPRARSVLRRARRRPDQERGAGSSTSWPSSAAA